MHCSKNRPQREKILIVAHADNYIEVFGSKNLVVRIERFPAVRGIEAECLAEDYVERALPIRWKELYWPGMLRASFANRPLLPSVIDEAEWTRDFLSGMNSLPSQTAPTQEVVTWML